MEEEKSLVCLLNGCEVCQLVRLVCQTLRHDTQTRNYLPKQLHCRWCGKIFTPINPFKKVNGNN